MQYKKALRGLINTTFLGLFVLTGCSYLVIKDEDGKFATTAKILTRVVLGCATLGNSERRMSIETTAYRCEYRDYSREYCESWYREMNLRAAVYREMRSGYYSQPPRRPLPAANASSDNPTLRGAAIGAGIVNGSSAATNADDPSPRQRTSDCRSDYDCENGSACVKAEYETFGFCASKVDKFGMKTYSLHDPNSIFPGEAGNCHFDTDCPTGFTCFKSLGKVSGNCLK